MTYAFKIPGLFKVSADVAGQVCKNLSETEGGLTPGRLVDISRAKDAPLHNEFEWDDAVAGEKYREQQAQRLIQQLIIVKSDSETERKVKLERKEKEEKEAHDRGFVSTGENNARYVTLSNALSNDQWRNNLLKAAKKDSEAFIYKYHRLAELANIIKDMQDFIDNENSQKPGDA